MASSLLFLDGASAQAQTPDEEVAEQVEGEATRGEAARREASTRFRRGVELYNEGNFEAALIEFQRTYEIAPSYRVLFNIGQTQLALLRYLEALNAFERYLAEGGDQVPEERREMLIEHIRDLRSRTGTLTITVDVPSARITIDDEPRGEAPLAAPIALDVGRHRVEVRASGYEPTLRTVSLAGGENLSLELSLVPLPTITVQAATVEVEDRRRMRSVGRIGLVVTGVLGAGAGLTGGLSYRANWDFERELGTFPGDPSQLASARDRTRALSLATDVLGGAAIGVGVTSLVLLLVDARRHRDTERPSVSVSVQRNGVVVGGSF